MIMMIMILMTMMMIVRFVMMISIFYGDYVGDGDDYDD